MITKKTTNATMHVVVVTKFIAKKVPGHTATIAIAILLVRSAWTCTKRKPRLETQPVQICNGVKIVDRMCTGWSKRISTGVVSFTVKPAMNTLCLAISVLSNRLTKPATKRSRFLSSLTLSAHRTGKFPVSKVMPHIQRHINAQTVIGRIVALSNISPISALLKRCVESVWTKM